MILLVLKTDGESEDVEDASSVFEQSFGGEEKSVSQDFQTEFQTHEKDETAFSDLKLTMIDQTKARRFEHHGQTRQHGNEDHHPIQIGYQTHQISVKGQSTMSNKFN